jgi:hypothetical protein
LAEDQVTAATRIRAVWFQKQGQSEQALEAFLSLIEQDISGGQNVNSIPAKLAADLRRAMKEVNVDLGETVEGDVCL